MTNLFSILLLICKHQQVPKASLLATKKDSPAIMQHVLKSWKPGRHQSQVFHCLQLRQLIKELLHYGLAIE